MVVATGVKSAENLAVYWVSGKADSKVHLMDVQTVDLWELDLDS